MKLHNPFRTALVVTLGVGLGLLLIDSFQTLSTILLYVGTALFLSLGLDPVVVWLEKRGLKRWLAVLVTILGVLAVFASIVLIVVPVIIAQITQLVETIQKFASSRTLDQFVQDLREWIMSTFPGAQPDIIDGLYQSFMTWLSDLDWASIGGGVLTTSIAILTGLAGAFIILILTIYLTASTPALKRSVYQLVPASKRARFIELSEQVTASVGFYVMGQVTLGAINGTLSFLLLSIIQAPFPAVLAVIAFFFSLIPLVGTLTGSTIIVLVCFIPGLGSTTTGIIAAVYYLIYMQIEAYVISPRIMSRAVAVPGAVVVIAALAGGALLGLLGALIAIPVAASILIIYRQVVIPRQNEK